MFIRKGRKVVGLLSGLIVLLGALALLGTRPDAPERNEGQQGSPEIREIRSPLLETLGPGELLAAA